MMLYLSQLMAPSFQRSILPVCIRIKPSQLEHNSDGADDLFESNYFTSYQPSAIKTINGVDVTAYLTEFASKNSVGTLEKHADWNQLMLSAALDIQGSFDVFSGGATFYPGDTITTVLENGTSFTDNFLAVYNSPGPTGPLETGGDFYNFFVLGFYPASYNDSSSSSDSSSALPSSTAAATSTAVSSPSPTPSNWDNPAYPDTPDVFQTDLGTYGGGYVSGEFVYIPVVHREQGAIPLLTIELGHPGRAFLLTAMHH
jgi:hypothetical protein